MVKRTSATKDLKQKKVDVKTPDDLPKAEPETEAEKQDPARPIPPAVEEQAPTEEPGEGHNSGEVTAETLHWFMRQLEAAEKKVDDAKKEFKGVRAKMEVQGIRLDVFDEVRSNSEQDDTTTRRTYDLRIHYSKLMGLPIGDQLSLLDADEAFRAKSEEDLIADARMAGYRAGMLGKNPEVENPHQPETPAFQAWMAGWNDGQAAIAAEMKAQKEKTAAEDAGETE